MLLLPMLLLPMLGCQNGSSPYKQQVNPISASCLPLTKIKPAPSLNPAGLNLDSANLTFVLPPEAGVSVISIRNFSGADMIYLEACRNASLSCFTRFLREPLTYEQRFEPGGQYHITARSCVWPDRAHSKATDNGVQRISFDELSNLSVYCGQPLKVLYTPTGPALRPDQRQRWQELYKLETKLHALLYELRNYLSAYLYEAEPANPQLASAINSILLLRDRHHNLALSPFYDLAFAEMRTALQQQPLPGTHRGEQPVNNLCARDDERLALLAAADSWLDVASTQTLYLGPDSPSARLSAKASAFTLLTLGGIAPAYPGSRSNTVTFASWQESLFVSLATFASSPTATGGLSTLSHSPSSSPSNLYVYGLGVASLAHLDAVLASGYGNDLGDEQARAQYGKLLKQVVNVGERFHSLRQQYLYLKRQLIRP